MATRVKAKATFSNKDYLDHVENSTLNTGEVATIDSGYAEQLQQNNLIEVLEENVPMAQDNEEESETVVEEETADEQEEEGPEYEHTDYVTEDGTFTDEMPFRGLLESAGISSVDDLKFYQNDFTEITGISERREPKLREAWNEIRQ